MPSIQQIIAEIQLANDLPLSHKVKAVQIIRDAEARLKIKNVGSNRKYCANKKDVMILEDWEKKEGVLLNYNMLSKWIKDKGLCSNMVNEAIELFREKMIANKNKYGDFVMAFRNYLRNDWLPIKYNQCKLKNSPYSIETSIETKGINL